MALFGNGRLFRSSEVVAFFAVSTLICLGLAGLAVWSDLETARNNFRKRTDNLQRTIAHQFGNTDTVLTSLVGLHHSSERLEDYEFSSQARELLSAYPFVKAIARAEKVIGEDRAMIEARRHLGGYPGFAITTLDANDKFVASPRHAWYLPIDVFEPFDPVLARLVGYDLSSKPALLQSISRAVSSGKVVASEAIDLPGIGQGIFIFKAFYLGHATPTSEAARRIQMGGVTAVLLEPNQFFELLVTEFGDLSFGFYDSASGDPDFPRLLFSHTPESPRGQLPMLPPFTSHIPIDENFASFVLEVRSYPKFDSIRLWLVAMLFGIGTLGCTFFALAMWNKRAAQARSLENEQTLRENEQRFRDYAEIASDWFWSADQDLRFDYLSEQPGVATAAQLQTLLGGTMDNIEGITLEPAVARRYFTKLRARRAFRDIRYSFEDGQGQTRWWSVSGKPVFDSDGTFLGYRGTGRDITAEAEARIDLQRSKDEAEIANRAKSEFIANMSHELRTPLNAIIGFSEIIATDTRGSHTIEDYREYAGDIHASGQHLLSLINDILDLSKVESGLDELYEEAIDLPEVVRSLIVLLNQHAQKGEVALQVELQENLPVLHADQRKIKQILVNLLSNAIKFTRPGGFVALHAECDTSGSYVFRIIDNGIGMTPEEVKAALLKFRQIDSDLNRKYDGTGLGLPLSLALIELHGGTLEITSEKGRGTTVTVRLPAERSIARAARGTVIDASEAPEEEPRFTPNYAI